MPNPDLDAQVVVRLPRELAEALARDAITQERTVAQTVRLAIRQYLAGREA